MAKQVGTHGTRSEKLVRLAWALGLPLTITASGAAAAADHAQCSAGAWKGGSPTISVCNDTPLPMSAAGPVPTFPSVIPVAGLGGVISRVDVRLRGVTHSNTSTMQLLLQPPEGDAIELSGSSFARRNPLPPAPPVDLPTASDADWTFTDHAAEYGLFYGMPTPGHPTAVAAPTVTREYLPRGFTLGNFPAPAPIGLASQLLSSQIGGDPNGEWSLYVLQVALSNAGNPQPTGTIADGWCLDIHTTPESSGCYVRTELSGAITGADLLQTGRINRDGSVGLCTAPKSNVQFNSTAYHYDAHAIANTSPLPSCITVTGDFNGCAGGSTQLAAYDSFNPLAPGDGLLADPGFSSTGRIGMSFPLAAGDTATLVVHETIPDAGCPAYVILLEQNPCLSAPAGILFANGFEAP